MAGEQSLSEYIEEGGKLSVADVIERDAQLMWGDAGIKCDKKYFFKWGDEKERIDKEYEGLGQNPFRLLKFLIGAAKVFRNLVP